MVVYPTGLAMRAYNNINRHGALAARALERVSSGKRINRAADDPAGIAIAERMRAQLTLLSRQQSNAADMLSAAQIEDGTLAEVGSIMNRLQDLATQAASDTFSAQDRKNLDAEYQELLKAINGMDKLKDAPTFNIFGDSPTVPAASGATAAPPISGDPILSKAVNLKDYLDALDEHMAGLGKVDADKVRSSVLEFSQSYMQQLPAESSGISTNELYTLKITGHNVSLGRSEQFATDRYGLTGSNILTQEGATSAMDAVKKAHEILLERRGAYGALERRLGHTMNNLQNMEAGLTDSYSRLVDADIAKEYSTFVREQAMGQAASMMLAHINSNAYQVLALLRQ